MCPCNSPDKNIEKHWLTILAIALLLLGCQGCSSISQVAVDATHDFPVPMRTAVLDFDWEPPTGTLQPGQSMVNSPNAGTVLADAVSARFMSIPGVEVFERTRLGKLLQEKELTQTALVKQGNFREIGEFLGVDYLVLGSVGACTAVANGPFGGNVVSFTCRCICVKTGKSVWMLQGSMEKGGIDPARTLSEILDDAIPKLSRQLDQRRRNQPGR